MTKRRAIRMVALLGLIVGVLPLAGGVDAPAATAASISVGDVTGWEGNAKTQTLVFSVTLSQPSSVPVTVAAQVVGGTATTPSDYTSTFGSPVTVSFAAGARTRFVNVTVKGDTAAETDETFSVLLSNPSAGYGLDRSVGNGVIRNDDPTTGLLLGVGDASVSEGDTGTRTVKLWVGLSEPSAANVTVTAAVAAGTATAGVEFKPVTKSLVFKPGVVKKPVIVTVYPDLGDESDETFVLTLSGASGASIGDATGTGTILDDDAATVQTASFRLGPFVLAPMGEPGSESNSNQLNIPKPAGAFGIKGMRFDLVHGDGTSEGHHNVHLHHVVLMDSSRPDSLCPSLPNRFSGSGAERTPLVLGENYAYEVGATDQWNALWHVMNMSMATHTVYIEYEIDYVTGADLDAARPLTSYFYDVDGCWGDSEFNVPGGGGPGSVYTKSLGYTAPRSGTRVFTGGHLHDGGIDTFLTQNGTEVCRNEAMYEMGELMSIGYCDAPVPVSAGSSVTLTARYDNENPIVGAMGISLSYVWEP